MPPLSPIRVEVLSDHEIVVSGLVAMLEPFADRVQVFRTGVQVPRGEEIDVVLYDIVGRPDDDRRLRELMGVRGVRTVALTWAVDSEEAQRALLAGADGCLLKTASAREVVEAVEAVHGGRPIGRDQRGPATTGRGGSVDPPVGLSAREAEVLSLLAQGLSNREIADRCYLSINTVKTYVRVAYRKIGVTRRAQAVAWALRNGLGTGAGVGVDSTPPGGLVTPPTWARMPRASAGN